MRRPRIMRARFAAGALLSCVALAHAADVALIDPAKPLGGWTFGNGPEFPGATGSLALEPAGGRGGGPALALSGNFEKGGNYVQASRADILVPLRTLSLWVRAPGAKQLTLRLVDEGGTCHQLNLRLTPSEDWQRLVFPAADYFSRMADSPAAALVAKYEHWGKTKGAGWQGRLASLHVLAGRGLGASPVLRLSDASVTPADAPAAAAPAAGAAAEAAVSRTLPLDEVLQAGEIDWVFDNGREFPGAAGALTLLRDRPEPGRNALRLEGDFAGGGAYVQATRRLDEMAGMRLDRLLLRVRSENVKGLSVRLVDATGQCHQRKGVKIAADGQWHDLVLRPAEIAGGEHWAGANDGQWHDPPRLVALILGKTGGDPKPAVEFVPLAAEVVAAAQAAAPAWREGFEEAGVLAGWTTVGAVSPSPDRPFAGAGLLRLARTVEAVNAPVSATGPAFAVRPGPWQVSAAGRSALYSPDDSYQGVVAVEFLDAAGARVGRDAVAELRGTNAWKVVRRTVEAPAGAAAARFAAALEKTYGTLDLDELSAAPVVAAADGERPRVARVEVAPARLGALFLPEETPSFAITVRAAKPLRPEELAATATVADYWGAEQGPAQPVALQRTGFANQAFQYSGALALDAPPLEAGRFYRLHVDVPQRGAKPFRQTIGLAKLAEAPARRLPPESVPFTIRNWDSRIPDYFRLSDRLGFRMVGVWGGWDLKPPHKPRLPGLDLCTQLGMKWISGLPGSEVERGKAEWADPSVLRDGMTKFLAAYATNGLAYLCLGNEPHGGPAQVASNVAAYKVLYEAAKAFDPAVRVIATSVEPNEEYFRQGFQNACDLYDFHVYESYPNVRKALDAYRALARKYGAEKPIVSTELGLNCQGMSRLAVSREMVKKFAVFFAGGGSMASWFTILYPDREGKAANSAGQAFNVFDCRYNLYNPKLDAVTLYHAVNGIGNKGFRAERHDPDGTQSYLFANADGECALILWNDRARTDVGVALPGAATATAVLLDGAARPLVPEGGAVTLTASADPLIVLYRAGSPALAPAPAAPALALESAPPTAVKGRTVGLRLRGPGLAPGAVAVDAPPGWSATCRAAGPDAVVCDLSAPAETGAEAGRIVFGYGSGGRSAAAVVAEVPLAGGIGGTVRALPATSNAPAALGIALVNRAPEEAMLYWDVRIAAEHPMAGGKFNLTEPAPPRAGFGEASDGSARVGPGATTQLRVPLRDVDPQTLYRVRLEVRDEGGRVAVDERFVAGFLGVPRGTPKVDGDLGDAAWSAAPPAAIGEARQFFAFRGAAWDGPADLSADVRFLWDERFLYIGARVRDDVFAGTREGSALWNQDGLQILVDPARGAGAKAGYYDCWAGLGTKGPQAWCGSTASPAVSVGEMTDALLAVRRTEGGGADYEWAIPWSRLAPFVPAPGAGLGLALIVNDDDGAGRYFLGWFGGVHSKELDMLGDLILQE